MWRVLNRPSTTTTIYLLQWWMLQNFKHAALLYASWLVMVCMCGQLDRQKLAGWWTGHSTQRTLTTQVPQGSVLAPVLFNVFIKDKNSSREHCHQVCSWHYTGGTRHFAEEHRCHPERPTQAGGMGWQKYAEIQQGQIQMPAAEKEEIPKNDTGCSQSSWGAGVPVLWRLLINSK